MCNNNITADEVKQIPLGFTQNRRKGSEASQYDPLFTNNT